MTTEVSAARAASGGAPHNALGGPGRPIPFTDDDVALVRFGSDGLVPAVVQDVTDGTVLMLGYMNGEALRRTLSTGRTWFWSRSRQEYWCKGETSGDRQWVRAVHYDCDGDALLVVVDQEGRGACHTGARSCFYRSFGTPT
jgi:phosphoribosyl-AMP cyclohydrolase